MRQLRPDLRLLIVDDERLARQELRRLLAEHAGVEIVGEAAHGEQALTLHDELHPDALLLDVQMPGMDGLAVARALGAEARILFCTAHSQFALEAFALNALDYLLKPVEPARLAQALERLRQALPHGMLLPDEHRVLLRRGERLALVRLGDIGLIESRDNYLSLHTRDGEYLLAGSLSRLLPRLDPQRWLQLSRQAIVRLDAIASLQARDGVLHARLLDGREVTVSRRQAQLLRQRFSLV